MNKEYLKVLLVDVVDENIIFFKTLFNELKVGVKLSIFKSSEDLIEYLDHENTLIPETIFMNYDVFKNDLLDEIIMREKFHKVITVIYSEKISDDETDDFFVRSGNICIKKTDNETLFKKKISEVITVNWQYYTSGLNKDNFILKM